MTERTVREADLGNTDDQRAVLELVNAYACDPMGRGKALDQQTLDRLIPALREHPTTLILLAFAGAKPVGIAVCFLGMSTFAAQPLVNVHDLAVLPEYRGQGVGKRLLAAVEESAGQRGCCAVTLEVDEANTRARQTYAAAGFRGDDRVSGGGQVFFMKKPLSADHHQED